MYIKRSSLAGLCVIMSYFLIGGMLYAAELEISETTIDPGEISTPVMDEGGVVAMQPSPGLEEHQLGIPHDPIVDSLEPNTLTDVDTERVATANTHLFDPTTTPDAVPTVPAEIQGEEHKEISSNPTPTHENWYERMESSGVDVY